MKLISQKKQIYGIGAPLATYLREFGRWLSLPVSYGDLLRYKHSVTLYDQDENDSLWITVTYDPSEKEEIEHGLLQIYSLLRAEGNIDLIEHLVVDRIDLCLYGNTKPFRIRIINTLNDNFDYFYVKYADASRVYGLELEHILSPYRIAFLVHGSTLIEEHIYGIPGDAFIERYMDDHLNEVRLAKEFVKFNERCFIRLLGDMHSSNYVVDITLDLEQNIYRIRAIDFDQQCYEGHKKVYLPQYFKENLSVVKLVSSNLTSESIKQYQYEEKSLIHKRMISSHYRMKLLLKVMIQDQIAPTKHVKSLAYELSKHYNNDKFLSATTMGWLLQYSLEEL
ncbi:MAG: hypothetical protein R3B45_06310 [Bdellovibrionota bacterium]